MLEAECLTSLEAHDQLLYFTSSSLTKDGRSLVMISERTGHPNLFSLNLAGGEQRQMTFNADGYLKSYVYFNGGEHRGFGKASVSMDAQRGIVYYIQDRAICASDLNGQVRVLGMIPDDQVTAFTHVSADGKRLCVPTTDARALECDPSSGKPPYGKPPYDIDLRVREERLNSYLRIYDTASGEELAAERVPCGWVTHVQFSPVDPDLIVYNHEWTSENRGLRRIWLWDGKTHRQVRTAGEGRGAEDWIVHEMWSHDGGSIIYHGKHADKRDFVGRYDCGSRQLTEIRLPEGYGKYGHFTAGNRHGDWLVSDGYYRAGEGEEEAYYGGNWISIQRVDWGRGQLDWFPLCRHDSNWDSQDSHPHPIFSHDDAHVYFTSNKAGKRAVYRVAVPDIAGR